MNKPWFKCWFGDAYKKLYPHRNIAEAENQVSFLLKDLQSRNSRFQLPSQNQQQLSTSDNSPENISVLKFSDLKI